MTARHLLRYPLGLMVLAAFAVSAPAFAGVVDFVGGIVESSRPVTVGPGVHAVGDDMWHSGVRAQSLAEAQDQLDSPLLDYFADYAEKGASVITAEHH